MLIRTKRILYTTAFAIFFIAAPLILGYSAGYRINWNNFRIFQTGLVYVETTPRLVTVELNDSRTTKLTPYRINDLYPGTYKLNIHKDGYYGWSKSIEIKSGESSIYKNIHLFPIATPEKLIENTELVSENNRSNVVIARTNNLTGLYALGDTEITKTTPTSITRDALNRSTLEAIYSVNNNFFITTNSLFEKDKNISEELKKSFHVSIQQVYWADTKQLILVDETGNIYGYNTNNNKSIILDKKGDSDDIYFHHDGFYFKIHTTTEGSFLMKREQDVWHTAFIFLRSERFVHYYEIENKLLHLIDQTHEIYYQIDTDAQKVTIYPHTREITEIDTTTLLSYNSSQVSVIGSVQNIDETLITRSSVGIKKAISLYEGTYTALLYGNGDFVIIENDTRDTRNQINMMQNIENIFLNSKKDALIIYKEKSFFKLPLE